MPANCSVVGIVVIGTEGFEHVLVDEGGVLRCILDRRPIRLKKIGTIAFATYDCFFMQSFHIR